jgi:hypothetical protein
MRYVNGKIKRAVWYSQTFQEEIEADFARYYHLDSLDVLIPGGMSWRKMLVLIEHLPSEGAVNTAIRNMFPAEILAENSSDPVKAPWSATESLLATAIDEIRVMQWIYMQVHSESKVPRPQPIPRPGVETKRKLHKISIADAQRLDPRLRGLSDDEARAKLRNLTGRDRLWQTSSSAA